jgi:LacI family transcriptional regulator
MTIRPTRTAESTRPPTIRDVAVRAGVSTGTVSSVITGLRPVAEVSRRLVHAAIDELGFKANYMASSLRIGKSRTIGVVVPNLANEFYASLVRHYEKEAAQIGYELLVVASGEDPYTEAMRIGSLIARRVDGLLVVAADDDFGSVAAFPKNLPPTVLVDRNFGNPRFDAVASDNFAAGKMGCELLLQLGHREIILLTPGLANANVRERSDGYRAAIRAAGAGVRDRVVIGTRTIDGCRAAVEQELHRPDPPTAIFATTYFATIGAVKAISSTGLRFPEEISLLGFEHSEWMTAIRPYISAISQAFDQLAAESWGLLFRRIAGIKSDVTHVRLPCTVNIRESARRPPTKDKSVQHTALATHK